MAPAFIAHRRLFFCGGRDELRLVRLTRENCGPDGAGPSHFSFGEVFDSLSKNLAKESP